MITQELPIQYGAGTKCVRFTLTYQDLVALATGVGPTTINLANAAGAAYPFAQGAIIVGIRQNLTTAFAFPANTALGVTIGLTGGSTTFFVAASYNLLTANTQQYTNLFLGPTTDVAFGLDVTLTGDGTHSLNTATAGVWYIDVFLSQFGPINVTSNPPNSVVG